MIKTRAGSALLAAALIATMAQAVVGVGQPAQAAIAQTGIVSANPADTTPYVLDGSVKAIVQSGSKTIVGGTFSQVKEFGAGKPVLARNNIFAFDTATGVIDTSFAPNINGLVAALAVSADGASVYVGGQFTTVNGVGPRSLARLNLSNGSPTAGFTAAAFNSQITDLKLRGNVLYTAGAFSYIGATLRPGLATVNATTGALTATSTALFSGAHNGGVTQVLKIDVSPAGDRLVAIGNFTTVNGVNRNQFAMFNITPTTTALGWYTPFYEGACSSSFQSYMRDVDFSPDGSFFVVSTTGAYGGSDSSCDLTARFETYTNSGENVGTTWRDYTGGDTTYAVAVSSTAVYVGGHQRWQNNAYAGDQAGPGAVSRPGIAALDPVNGLPYSWNPTRDTGVGVFDFLVTPTGLWEGSDTLNVGGEYHPRLAFFPLAGGTAVGSNTTGTVPNDVYLTGRTVNPSKPSVLYRIDTGGPAIPSQDDGPDWAGDDQTDFAYRNSGSNTASYSSVPSVDSTVPNSPTDRAPSQLFSSERWSPGNPEMDWSFPAPVGAQLTVRLYFANRYSGTSHVGDRVFNVDLDGTRVLNNYDIVADVGSDVGTMKSWNITSDGSVDIDFSHIRENPLVNGIEILRTDLPSGPVSTSKSDVLRRYFSGTTSDPTVTLSNTGPNWANARGSMLIDNTVYYASSDGTFNSVPFDGTTFGTAKPVNLYNGYFGGEASSVTGMFFSGGRMYYTVAGDNTLHYRYFTPESQVVGAIRYDATGSFPGSRVTGMFLSGGNLYYADATTGALMSVAFANNSLTGTPIVSDATQDWRTRGMFVWDGTHKPRVGTPPVARATANCTNLGCDFDGSASTDSDGSVVSYAWDFGDTTGSPASSSTMTSHTYSAPGDYTAILTATDDAGQTSTYSIPVTAQLPPNIPPTAVAAVHCTYLTCTVADAGSHDADGTIVGYNWDFGDGQSSTLSSDTHTFAGAGPYDIKLTVTDNRGGAGVTTTSVTVAPNQAPTAVVNITCNGLTCSNSSFGSTDLEGPIASYSWDFGDSKSSTDASPQHTYTDPGTYDVVLTVTDSDGLTSATDQKVTVAPVANLLPTSAPVVSCSYLVCTFDGSSSSDPDGHISTYAWNFDNGATSADPSGVYTFPTAGSYTIGLTVTDNDGGVSTNTVAVVVAPLTSPIAVVGSKDVQFNYTTGSLQAPSGIHAGDAMLMFITTNTTTTVSNLTGGWSLVGDQQAGDTTPDMRTRLYSRIAGPSDSGATSTLTLAGASKTTMSMLVYTGTNLTAPIAAWSVAKETATLGSHLTPTVAVSDPKSWAVYYWADKANVAGGWQVPTGTTVRSNIAGTGTGRIAALAVDGAGPLGAVSTVGGLSATAGSSTYKATMWSVILAAKP